MAKKNDVNIKVGMDTSGVPAGIKQAKNMISTFAQGAAKELGGIFGPTAGILGAAGPMAAVTAAGAMIIMLEKNTMDFAHSIQELSGILGISTDAAQSFAFAAELTGKDMGFVEGEMMRADQFAEQALSQEEKYSKQRALALKLGFSDAELQNMSPELLMKELVKRAKEVNLTDTDLDSIFGKRRGRAVRELVEKEEEVSKTTVRMTPEDIKLMAEAWESLKISMYNFWQDVRGLMADLTWAAKELKGFGGSVLDWLGLGDEPATMPDGIQPIIPSSTAEETKSPFDLSSFVDAADQNTRKAPEMMEKAAAIKSNALVAIGGLLGVDTNYRLFDIAQQQLSEQKLTNVTLGQILQKISAPWNPTPTITDNPFIPASSLPALSNMQSMNLNPLTDPLMPNPAFGSGFIKVPGVD